MLRRSILTLAALGLLVATPSVAHADGAKKPTHPSQQGKKKGKKGKKKGKKGKKKKKEWVGPFPKKQYPWMEIKRPLVLPDGMGEVGLDLGVASFAGVTAVSTAPSFSYGVADVVDFGVSTALLLSPDVAWSESFVLQGHYLAYDSKDIDVAPGVILPLVFTDGAGFSFTLEAPTRYVLNDKVYFTFGQGALPVVLSPDFGLAIAANGGVGYQVDKSIALFADTNVFTLQLAPDTAITGPWEIITLGLGGQYSWDRFGDVGARLSVTNVWEIDDSLFFTVDIYARYRF